MVTDQSAYPAFDLYFTQYKDYLNSFLNSSEYKYYFLTNYLPDYLNSLANQNSSENHKNSTVNQNFLNSEAYINDSLNSQAYKGYLNNFSKEYQNFIDSPIYNNSHNYLDSSEYLILSGCQYFANSTENRNFINSAEYEALLNYYFLYTSNEYPKYANSANEKYGPNLSGFSKIFRIHGISNIFEL